MPSLHFTIVFLTPEEVFNYQPYGFHTGYKRSITKTSFLRLGLNYSLSVQSKKFYFYDVGLNLGIEKRRNFKKDGKLVVLYGLDFIVGKYFIKYYRSTKAGEMFGFGPILGLEYRVSEKTSLSTETNIDWAYGRRTDTKTKEQFTPDIFSHRLLSIHFNYLLR